MSVNDCSTFGEFLENYPITGELWRVRKADGKVYRMLQTEFFNAPDIYVSHELDNLPLCKLYSERDNLLVVFKNNNTCVVYKNTWEEVLLPNWQRCETKEVSSHPIDSFVPTQEDYKSLHDYIRKGLYYYAYYLIVGFFSEGNSSHYSILSDYKKYLGLTESSDTEILTLGSLEFTEKTFRIAVGTIYGTWEMRYFFYVLYLQSKNGGLERKDIMDKGEYLGYSENTILDYIRQVKMLLLSEDSSLWDPFLISFKHSITKPYNRIAPVSVASFAYSVEDSSAETLITEGARTTDWSGYETMGYWDIDDESLREGLDDDSEAYWNID